jgi:asparagine synthase (glutamine-hydrolysing)
MTSADGEHIVVFNGEIYNYPELRADLKADGVEFHSNSDTEVLLHLYARHGAEMVQRLRGMYAFAIWDQRREGLFLARDPYGIKPLYTAIDGWTFRFASQVKALLAGRAVSHEPEAAGIVGFHLFGSVPEPFTLFRDIRALPAGHTQWVDAAGPREPRLFASVASILAKSSQERVPAKEICDQIRAGMLDSVRAHLLADVEIGVFLSAGVDSGALLGLMRDAGQCEIRAITLAFDEFSGSDEDESPLASLIARRYDARHLIRRVTQQEFLKDLPAILDAMDQPSIDGVNAWFIAKAAREQGLKVALSGLGGDEILGGYESFVDLPRWRRWFGPFASIPGLGPLIRLLAYAALPALWRTRPKALGLLEHTGTWEGAYLLRRGLFLPHELPGLIGAEVAREGLRRLQPLGLIRASLSPDIRSDGAKVCALESSNYMRNQLLRDTDWAGMAHSIEIRVPFVDSTLLARIAPCIVNLWPGDGKAALAKAPTLPLPDEVLHRPKTGFGVPTESWMSVAASEFSPSRHGTEPKGIVSRRWLRKVNEGFSLHGPLIPQSS